MSRPRRPDECPHKILTGNKACDCRVSLFVDIQCPQVLDDLSVPDLVLLLLCIHVVMCFSRSYYI